jgi:hypothetical protein
VCVLRALLLQESKPEEPKGEDESTWWDQTFGEHPLVTYPRRQRSGKLEATRLFVHSPIPSAGVLWPSQQRYC